MNTAQLTDSEPLSIRRGKYTLRRIRIHHKTRELGEVFGPVQQQLESTVAAREDAELNRQVLTGELLGHDSEFDGAVSQGSLEALAFVGGDRDDPHFREAFLTGRIHETVNGPMEDDLPAAQRIERAVAATPGLMKPETVTGILEAAQAVDRTIRALKEQAQVVAAAETAVTLARIPWVRAYNDLYPRLQLLFPGKKALVESFFLRVRRPTRNQAPDPTEGDE